MDSFQQEFAYSPIQSAKLFGNPGCGKTHSIIEFVVDKNLKSSEFFIFTYSKSAQEDFLTKGKARSNVFTSQNVRTLHSMAYAIYKKITGGTSKFLNTLILSTTRHMVKKSISIYKNVKVIIVDEAQDISGYQYQFVIELGKSIGCPIIMVGDPNQNIYQFQNGSDQYLLQHPGAKFELMNNYRSSTQIVDFINDLRPNYSEEQMICASNQEGPKPILFNGDIKSIERFILETVHNDNIDLSEIAFIGPSKLSKEVYAAIGLSFVAHVLHDAGVPFVQHYNDGKEKFTKKFVLEKGKANLFTCHGSKGLEFHTVIVINYHLNTFGRKPTENEYYDHRYLWYVAFSRAKHNLFIIKADNKMINPQIRTVCESKYITQGSLFHIPQQTNFAIAREDEIFHITQVIDDMKIFNDEALLEFQESCFYFEETEILNSIDMGPTIDQQYAAMCGIAVEMMFRYIIEKNSNFLRNFYERIIFDDGDIIGLLKKISEIVSPRGEVLYELCTKYSKRCPLKVKPLLNKITNRFYEIAKLQQVHPRDISLYLYATNNAQVFDRELLLKYCADIDASNSNSEVFEYIFEIAKHLYAFSYERRLIHDIDIKSVKEDLLKFYPNIKNAAELYSMRENKFEVNLKHPLFDLIGRADVIVDDDIILELKFTNEITELHKLQCLMYMACSGKDKGLIFNIKSMKTCKLTINLENKWKLHQYIARKLKLSMPLKTFVIDLETNSKVASDVFPIISDNSIEIIDHHIYELATNSVVSSGLVKNQWEITNSYIHGIEDASDGISKSEFKKKLASMKDCYLIAHNGNGFDFKVLDVLECLPDNAKLIDSRNILRSYAKLDKCPDEKLENLYRKYINPNYTQTHRAKEDVEMILALFDHFGVCHMDIIQSI